MKNLFKNWCYETFLGGWTESRLLSRKWWLVAATIPLVIVLDMIGMGLSDSTLNFMQFVIVAYLGVQGAIDFFRYMQFKKYGVPKNIEENQTIDSLLEENSVESTEEMIGKLKERLNSEKE